MSTDTTAAAPCGRILRCRHAFARAALVLLGALCLLGGGSREAAAQFVQVGSKLVGSNIIGSAYQGESVAVSADGNTLAIGGTGDNGYVGAAWVFTLINGVWTEQAKLAGNDYVANQCCYVEQGSSVALSADGNTLLVGGPGDNASTGAVWVFTRSNGVWTQQGAKLVANDEVSNGSFGSAAALSADGNTALIGGRNDNAGAGAAWVFTRSGTTWTQQGSKLVGTGGAISEQGTAIALSADGNTAAVGGPNDSSYVGATWVFTRSGGTWTQQGSKLVGSGGVGSYVAQGSGVALSGDGNTLAVGGPSDNSGVGAVWVFTQSGGTWTQEGSKLVGSGGVGSYVSQGQAVALSGDGNTLAVGGYADNDSFGATWVFTRSADTWSQQGSKLVGSGTSSADGFVYQGQSVALSSAGSTLVVGAPYDNDTVGTGAAWVFAQPPTVTAISPSSGPAAGGTLVTITGTGFTGATAVAFGSTAATSFTVNSATSITVAAPAGAGTVDVSVTAAGVASSTSAADQFTYIPPAVSSISPSSGPAPGGTIVTIGGINFTGATAVHFGVTAAAAFTVNSDSQIVATAPSGSGTVDITVTAAAATSATSAADQFTYIPAPAVTAVAPNSGPPAGGTSVAISGTNFVNVTAVNFGAVAAASFTVNGATSITATSPPGSGIVDVTVTSASGTSPSHAADGFSYSSVPAPAVTSIAPTSGPAAGGKIVTIGGSNFTGATAVSFGGAAASWFNVTSATSILAKSPAGTGTVDVTVTTGGGTSASSGADQFTYIAAPTVSSVAPNSGPTAGATSVAIGGANFTGATAVSFGGVPAAAFTVGSATSITATSPAGTAGTVNVTVTTPGGTSSIGAGDQFTYLAPTAPTITSVIPNGGPPAGGTSVTITGTNLTGAAAVTFGGAAAAQFAVNSATSITAVSPPGAIGAVDVKVTTTNGTSAASAADRFSYASPRATQQGAKLVGTGFSGAAAEGYSLALSSDGNTALVGGYNDNGGIGGFWIFTRSAGTWTQVGGKLIATGNVGAANAGWSVALSGDGNTALIGGDQDNAGTGAAWVFSQSGGVWTQQAKLIASDETGAGAFGFSVALSGDGNTALIGGDADTSNMGAAWVFARNGNSWAQVGSKLIGTGAGSTPRQGSAVALSGNGNTAIVGGFGDNANVGAVWVFTQSGGVWSQAAAKLTAGDEAGAAVFGAALALSADGNTALVGGYGDNADTGAAWVFTQSGGVWMQAGSKLVGTGAVGAARQGFAVALSADAGTAAIGGYEDGAFTGAAWLFDQSGGTWSQRGAKLSGTGAIGAAEQGIAVALSSDGRTLIAGGAFDSAGTGAAWVFLPADEMVDSHDFNGDGNSDILWRDAAGDVAVWLMNGGSLVQSAGLGAVPANFSIIGQHDFDGDGKADILWRDGSGNISMWFMNGAAVSSSAILGNVASNWTFYGTGDLNGDGRGDLLWRDSNTGTVSVAFMNGATVLSVRNFGVVGSNWSIVGETNGDIVWRDSAGDLALWALPNGVVANSVSLGAVTSNFVVAGVGDFNGDGALDILWRDTNSGALSIWFTNGTQVTSAAAVGTLPSNWSVAQIGDYNGDGKSDILLLDSSGDLAAWLMNGAAVSSSVGIANVGPNWMVQNVNAD